ncbi:MAG: hypothetical protein ACLQGP_41730 [Isosphaeraceae bacterium]
MVRVLSGGLLAGIMVFFWGAFAHMMLPLGELGVRRIPNEDNVIGAMRDNIHEPGFYFFPGLDMSRQASESDQQAWEAKVKQGPVGVVIIQPSGGEAMSPRQLGTELATNVVSALLAGLLLAFVRTGYWGRVLFVTLLGVFGVLTISVPYWNWYGFPVDFTIAEGIDQVAGWFLAGLVLAAIVRGPKAPAAV